MEKRAALVKADALQDRRNGDGDPSSIVSNPQKVVSNGVSGQKHARVAQAGQDQLNLRQVINDNLIGGSVHQGPFVASNVNSSQVVVGNIGKNVNKWHIHAPPEEPAQDVIDRLNQQVRWMEHQKKPDEAISILVATPFGVHRALSISGDGPSLLCVETMIDGQESVLFAHAHQCGFMFQVYHPTAGKPEQRVLINSAPAREQATS